MDKETAERILTDSGALRDDRKDELCGKAVWAGWSPGAQTIALDGLFTPDQLEPLVGKSCGDCPFWIPDLDLCKRTPLDRGQCDIDVERPKRTHVRRAICERAKQYFPNT